VYSLGSYIAPATRLRVAAEVRITLSSEWRDGGACQMAFVYAGIMALASSFIAIGRLLLALPV